MQWQVATDETFWTLYNLSSYSYEDTSPCNLTVPGFNSLGLTITYMIVFVFSMVGNSVVICVVWCMKTDRSSTDIYIMHLAMADLLFSLTLPFWAINAHIGWIFGNVLCKVLSGFQEASLYSGVFLLACISVDRHFAIVRATRIKPSRGLVVKTTCVMVWLVAVLLSIPIVLQRQSMSPEDIDQTICFDENTYHLYIIMHILHHILGFFLPLVVMAVCYGWTLVTLFHASHNQQKRKAIRVILAVVLAFVLCWLPYNVAVLIDTLIRGSFLRVESCETIYRVHVVRGVTQVLAFMHCAVNPVLYAFIGVKFRNQLLTTLHKHGVISNIFLMTYRKGSYNSAGSNRSRNTSATMYVNEN